MKIFSTNQIADIDKYTIENEPVSDIDLMERASEQLVDWIVREVLNDKNIYLFAGPGNNGGDALAVARILASKDYSVKVFLLSFGKELKGSPAINWKRLVNQQKVELNAINSEVDIPEISSDEVIIDGLFGSGLTRSLEALASQVVKKINKSGARVISIDIPSGLMGEDNATNDRESIICASQTLTLHFPKISFFFPENEKYVGDWHVLPIGLHPGAIEKTKSEYHYLDFSEIAGILKPRSRFTHKGTMGHALLIAGSYGKMGAAILASKACLRTGVGLLTTHLPRLGYSIIQVAVPEAMVSIDQSDHICTEFPKLKQFNVVGVGPGIGTKQNTQRALYHLLEQATKPMVLDADALNILSDHPEWMEELPEQSILTPHPGEFKRLVGEYDNSFGRLKAQAGFSKKYRVIMVLKGAFTTITSRDGQVYFNSSGNPGMATAGSGDALTGILTGLLAQGLPPINAALLGVYIHGLAGDIATAKKSQQSLIASDIIDALGDAFLSLKTRTDE